MISRIYLDKNSTIVNECKNKTVLDMGIVDHDVRYEQNKNWLHGKLKKVARAIIGLDIDREAIEILKNKGYNVIAANAEKFNLNKKFEVIVAGDILEHLNNAGLFLNSVKKHMNKNSMFIITVPNCLSFSNWIELVIFGKIKYINEEHTLWYDANTIRRVLDNNGFSVNELSFIINNPHFIGETKLRHFLKNMRNIFLISVCLIRKQLAPTIFIKARVI